MNRQYSLCLPYPEICGRVTSREMETLYDMAAGRFSEMTTLCSYVYQSVISAETDEISQIVANIAKVEMGHYELLAGAIFKLGGDPVFAGRYNYFSGSYVDYEKITKAFIHNDIDGELAAINAYREAAENSTNQSLSDLYLRIAMDEELHVQILSDLLQEITE